MAGPAGSGRLRECRPRKARRWAVRLGQRDRAHQFSNPSHKAQESAPLHTLRLVTSKGLFLVYSLKRKRSAGLRKGRGGTWSKRSAKERALSPREPLIGNRLAGASAGARPRGLRRRAFPPNSLLGFPQKQHNTMQNQLGGGPSWGGAAGRPPLLVCAGGAAVRPGPQGAQACLPRAARRPSRAR